METITQSFSQSTAPMHCAKLESPPFFKATARTPQGKGHPATTSKAGSKTTCAHVDRFLAILCDLCYFFSCLALSIPLATHVHLRSTHRKGRSLPECLMLGRTVSCLPGESGSSSRQRQKTDNICLCSQPSQALDELTFYPFLSTHISDIISDGA